MSRDPVLRVKSTSGNTGMSPCVCLSVACGSAHTNTTGHANRQSVLGNNSEQGEKVVRNSTCAHTKTIFLVIAMLGKYIRLPAAQC